MRALPAGLASALAGGVTTLCWCWRIERRDGVVLGFTDHDRDLAFDGVVHLRASGRSSGATETVAGLSGGGGALAGVLESAAITEEDIARGLYERAQVTLYRVDWSDPDVRLMFWSGRIGEIKRGELGFEAELAGLQSALQRSIGRTYARRCDAALGDGRCGVDLDQPSYRVAASVGAAVTARTFTTAGLAGYTDGWFSSGVLRWQAGANAGATSEVEAHRDSGVQATIELLAAPPKPMAAGDAFIIDAGCDKRWATCKAKFANTVNFRGFPMMPGDDWLQAGPRSADPNDGGSLWTRRDA